MHPPIQKADDLSGQVNGAAIEVHRLKGPGFEDRLPIHDDDDTGWTHRRCHPITFTPVGSFTILCASLVQRVLRSHNVETTINRRLDFRFSD
jgi:hypothetical protein